MAAETSTKALTLERLTAILERKEAEASSKLAGVADQSGINGEFYNLVLGEWSAYQTILGMIRNEPCGECNHRFSEHTASGCQAERGDALIGGVMQAAGPCTCKEWR
jgi:hypothetical protein